MPPSVVLGHEAAANAERFRALGDFEGALREHQKAAELFAIATSEAEDADSINALNRLVETHTDRAHEAQALLSGETLNTSDSDLDGDLGDSTGRRDHDDDGSSLEVGDNPSSSMENALKYALENDGSPSSSMQAVLQRFAPNIPNLEQRTFGLHDRTSSNDESSCNPDNNRDPARLPGARGHPDATSPLSRKDLHDPRGSSSLSSARPLSQPHSLSGRIFGTGEYLDIGTTMMAEAGARVHEFIQDGEWWNWFEDLVEKLPHAPNAWQGTAAGAERPPLSVRPDLDSSEGFTELRSSDYEDLRPESLSPGTFMNDFVVLSDREGAGSVPPENSSTSQQAEVDRLKELVASLSRDRQSLMIALNAERRERQQLQEGVEAIRSEVQNRASLRRSVLAASLMAPPVEKAGPENKPLAKSGGSISSSMAGPLAQDSARGSVDDTLTQLRRAAAEVEKLRAQCRDQDIRLQWYQKNFGPAPH